MELKQIIKKIRRYKWSFLASVGVGAVLGILIYFLPPKYLASGSFYVKRSISGERNFFTYEGYYGQQTALSYTNSVVALLESLDLKKVVLEKMGIKVNEQTLRKFSHLVKVRKTGPQIISVTVKGKSYKEAENIWDKLSETLIATTQEINKNGDPNLSVAPVSSQPVVKETYRSLYLFGIAGALISATLFSFYICIKEYLRD